MKNRNIFLDIHAIQSVPPSNINRDDTGSPKIAQYGGVTRARVSSQSWKKGIRTYFSNFSEEENFVGIRSLDTITLVGREIRAIDNSIDEDRSVEMAADIISKTGIKIGDNKMKALFFISKLQASGLAKAAIDGLSDKKELQKILNSNPSIDMALFGRMVADDPKLNEDASSQIAHAISTHAVQTEFDFYTATDDLKKEDSSGAGMIGTIEFNSSTLYRYGNVAVHEFFNQLGEKESAIEALKLFIEAFIMSMPSGKINTFANQTLPQAIVITVRKDRPVNLVSAFETPVKSNNGYVLDSIQQLTSEFEKVIKFVEEPVFTLTIGVDEIGIPQDNIKVLLNEFGEKISELL